jgi:hypothetical protein
MADAVTTKTLISGSKRIILQLTNISDGTGESAVTKLDISALTGPNGVAPTKISIEEIQWCVQGFSSVRLLTDHTADDVVALLSGNGYRSYHFAGFLIDPASAGDTGDLLLTTVGATTSATYDILITIVLG